MAHKFRDLFRALFFDRRMLIVFLMGFSSGLPYSLLADNISLWLRTEKIDLTTIGYMGWITLPFSLKFVWSFALDRFSLGSLGRRRSWLLFSQIGIATVLYLIGTQDPSTSLKVIAALGIMGGLFAATQDIAVDAYRREILNDEEQGIGATLYSYAYRIAVLVSSGFGVWVVSEKTWNYTFGQSYQLMAAFMLIGVLATLWAKEPKLVQGVPKSITESILEPLREFFLRPNALWVLAFVVLYKLGDAMAGKMLSPFYVDLGFELSSLAITRKAVGLYSNVSGLALGGLLLYWLGLYRCLFIFGIFQALSTMSFAIMPLFGAKLIPLAIVMSFEDVTAGMGTAALMAFLALLTNQKFTATQFALLSSLATLGRNFFAGYSGKLVTALGNPGNESSGFWLFFISCAIMAVPGLYCLYQLRRNDVFR